LAFYFTGINKKFLPLLFTTAFPSEAEVIFRNKPFQLIGQIKKSRLFQRKSEPVFLLITGVGHQLESSSLEPWLKHIAPALLINFGICGGLDTTLPLFQNYLVSRVQHLEEQEISLELLYPELLEKLLNHFPACCLLTSEHPVLQEPLRKQLHQQTSCQLLDMEGYKLVKTAIDHSLPIILLKQLTDYCNEDTVRIFRENQSIWQNSLEKGLIQLLNVLSGCR